MFKLNHFSLTTKMLITSLVVGLVVWAFTDTIQTYSLKTIFHNKLSERFSKQSENQRIMFDRYVKGHHQAVSLFVNTKALHDYVKTDSWHKQENPKIHRDPPQWLPKLSAVRNFILPRYILLLDAEGNTIEMYQADNKPAPEIIMQPNRMLLNLSHNQGYLTQINKEPYLIASDKVIDENGATKAILMLASPLDEEFLNASQGVGLSDSNIIALLIEEEPKILVSSNSSLLSPGTEIDNIKDRYLVIGQGFFDYGATDIIIELVSFISTSEVQSLTSEVLSDDRSLRSVTAIVFIAAFSLVMLFVTRRLRRFTSDIIGLSKDINLAQTQQHTGDEIVIKHVNVSTNDEFKDLAIAFNNMIDSLKDSYNKLATSNKKLTIATETKDSFMANMSHELRTPLNAIIGFSEILLEDAEPDSENHSDLKRIHAAGVHLLSIINNILDLSKVEAGKMEVSPIHFSIESMIREVCEMVAPLVNKNNNECSYDVASELDTIYSDEIKIRQILYNLLSNAVKFTQNGKIRVTANEFISNNKPWLVIKISDTGIGLTEEQQKKLFKPFTQADTSTNKKYGGTGLGLSICKKFCNLIGGQINVKSSPNKGSVFTIELPKQYTQVAHTEPE